MIEKEVSKYPVYGDGKNHLHELSISRNGDILLMNSSFIHPDAKIDPSCQLGEFCVVEEGTVLEAGVILGHHVIVHAGTRIGRGTKIGDACVIGRTPIPAATSTVAIKELPPLVIGNDCVFSSNVVVYRGSEIGDSCFFGDAAYVRENCQLGRFVLVGRNATIENDVIIGDYCKIQTGAYITADSKLADHVFVAPMVTTTNDNFMGRTEKRFALRRGPILKRGCRIGGGAHLLPGVMVGEEAFVATGSTVTKDVPPYSLVMGTPARVVRQVPEDELIITHNDNKDDQSIPGFDLRRQNKMLQRDLIDIFAKIVDSGQFILGDQVKALEVEIADFCGVRYGIGVGNGSDALYLALLSCGIGPGDEVITTPFTFFATAGSIVRTGAIPVFVDIDLRTYNIDTAQIEAKITPRTKAILPVHLFGQPAEMGKILDIADHYQLKVIEDAAQALGAAYRDRYVGSFGDAGCFSFFPTKNLGCFGDGGMVVTDDEDIADKIRALRVHGSKQKYHHEYLGINSRLDALQAAILRLKFPHLSEWTDRRRRLANIYRERLQETDLIKKQLVRLPYNQPDCFHVYNQFTIAVSDRDGLRSHLQSRGISTTIYYPLALHLQPVFNSLGYKPGDFPKAEQATGEVISLPIFPELTDDEVACVVEAIRNYYGE